MAVDFIVVVIVVASVFGNRFLTRNIDFRSMEKGAGVDAKEFFFGFSIAGCFSFEESGSVSARDIPIHSILVFGAFDYGNVVGAFSINEMGFSYGNATEGGCAGPTNNLLKVISLVFRNLKMYKFSGAFEAPGFYVASDGNFFVYDAVFRGKGGKGFRGGVVASVFKGAVTSDLL